MNRYPPLSLAALLWVAATSAAAQTNPDVDADGVPDAKDACPATPRGLRIVDRGCAAVELARTAAMRAAPVLDAVEEVESVIGTDSALRSLLASVSVVSARIEAARDALFRGDILGSAALWGQASDKMLAVLEQIDGIIASTSPAAFPIPAGATEFDGFEMRLAYLNSVKAALASLSDAIAREGAPLRAAAAGARPGMTARGAVIKRDDNARWIQVESGRVIALPADLPIDNVMMNGPVTLRGTWFDAQTGVATDISSTPPVGVSPDGTRCVAVRLAPVQQFFPKPPTHLLHEPAGYLSSGQYWLEAGMRLAVIDTGCAKVEDPAHPGNTIRSFLKAKLQYTDKTGHAKVATLTSDLNPGDEPVGIPDDVDSTKVATLAVKYMKSSCATQPCTYTQVAEESLPVRVRSNRSYCNNVMYTKDVFTLPEGDMQKFELTTVGGFTPIFVDDTDSPPKFAAEGYQNLGNGQTSYPVRQLMVGYLSFAIYNHDFFSDPNQLWELGVTTASGLVWPRLEGTRAGKPFRYSCPLPRIIRDAVNYCTTLPHAFYRAPTTPDAGPWKVGQGVNGQFSHQGLFAWDLGSSDNQQIRAARGGVVTALVDWRVLNCFDLADGDDAKAVELWGAGWCYSNFIQIRHQDGTFATYKHIAPSSSQVAVGQVVKRGQYIADEGNIGYSKGQHLHFELGMVNYSYTIPARFEDKFHTCWVPLQDEWVYSTNVMN